MLDSSLNPNLFEKYILEHISWLNLPIEVKNKIGNSKATWTRLAYLYYLQHQLEWKFNIPYIVRNEKVYYSQLLDYSSQSYMIYPYHIGHIIVRLGHQTPFEYYSKMIYNVMIEGLRWLGIGRNEFISIMNQVKTKDLISFWSNKKKIIKSALPSQPMPTELAPWWLVYLGKQAGEFDKDSLHSLYLKDYVYLDVPVEEHDQIVFPMLEDFVMNRITGDYFENLLYRLFITLDENCPIEKLAQKLDLEIKLVKQAVSLYLRLGFAKKNMASAVEWKNGGTERGGYGLDHLSSTKWHSSWALYQEGKPFISFNGNSADEDQCFNEYLPLAVDCFLEQDQSILSTDFVQRLNHDQAIASIHYQSLSIKSPSFSNSLPASSPPPYFPFSDLLNSSSFHHPKNTKTTPCSHGRSDQPSPQLIALLFDYSLAAVLMMANLGDRLKQIAVMLFEVGRLTNDLIPDLITQLAAVPSCVEAEVEHYCQYARSLHYTLCFLRDSQVVKDAGFNGIDLLRCERLQTLDKVAMERCFNQGYQLFFSVAPFASNPLYSSPHPPLNTSLSPAHLSSPWFKLFVYECAGGGPNSILFPCGIRVTQIPPLLLEYDYVWLEPWHGIAQIVPVCQLLPILNDQLMYEPILVQEWPYPFTPEPNSAQTMDLALPIIVELNKGTGEMDVLENNNMLNQDDPNEEVSFENGGPYQLNLNVLNQAPHDQFERSQNFMDSNEGNTLSSNGDAPFQDDLISHFMVRNNSHPIQKIQETINPNQFHCSQTRGESSSVPLNKEMNEVVRLERQQKDSWTLPTSLELKWKTNEFNDESCREKISVEIQEMEKEQREKDQGDDDLPLLKPYLTRLNRVIDLRTTSGYVTMLRIPSTNSLIGADNDKNQSEWVPFEVHFEIPLFSTKLNRQVFERCEKLDFFTPANLDRQREKKKKMINQLLVFIGRYHHLDRYDGCNDLGLYPAKMVAFQRKTAKTMMSQGEGLAYDQMVEFR